MGRKERRLAIIFEDTSPGAKKFATAVMDLAERIYPDEDFEIQVDFSVPKDDARWRSIRPSPTIGVNRLPEEEE